MPFLISSIRDISPFNTFHGFAIFWFVLYILDNSFILTLSLATKYISLPLPNST